MCTGSWVWGSWRRAVMMAHICDVDSPPGAALSPVSHAVPATALWGKHCSYLWHTQGLNTSPWSPSQEATEPGCESGESGPRAQVLICSDIRQRHPQCCHSHTRRAWTTLKDRSSSDNLSRYLTLDKNGIFIVTIHLNGVDSGWQTSWNQTCLIWCQAVMSAVAC